MDYWLDFFHKIFETAASIAAVVAVVVGIFLSRDYIAKTKDRQYEAAFSFYSRLYMYLLDIKSALGEPSNTILLHKYTRDCVEKLTNISLPSESKTKRFRKLMRAVLCFLKSADHQLAPSQDILDNMDKLKKIVVEYQYLGYDSVHPYSEFDNNAPVKDELKKTSDLLSSLINDIKNYHSEIMRTIGNLK